jgi:hypothetical protein
VKSRGAVRLWRRVLAGSSGRHFEEGLELIIHGLESKAGT